MEVEDNFGSYFPDRSFEGPPENEQSLKQTASCAAGGSRNILPENDFLDCNICLDFASDPVVTLCGHLYCWPCIYRWLHPTPNNSPRQCPVCKFPISESSIVPLYGRGHTTKTQTQHPGIPDRPKATGSLIAVDRQPPRPGSENHPFYFDGLENHRGVLSSTVGVVLCEMAFAMLPSAFTAPPSLYLSPTVGEVTHDSPRWRRQEMRVESWLKQLWMFLLCCAVLCLFFF